MEDTTPDALEQAQEVDPPESAPPPSIPIDAPEADVVEQSQPVPFDDEDRA